MINQNSTEYEKETVIMAQLALTTGSIPKTLLRFAFPMICGNLLQQLYKVADTLIVGRFLGSDALGAVGSSYTLMTILTTILLGLCMGSGAAISMQYGSGEYDKMRQSVFQSFALIAGMALADAIGIGCYLLKHRKETL